MAEYSVRFNGEFIVSVEAEDEAEAEELASDKLPTNPDPVQCDLEWELMATINVDGI